MVASESRVFGSLSGRHNSVESISARILQRNRAGRDHAVAGGANVRTGTLKLTFGDLVALQPPAQIRAYCS